MSLKDASELDPLPMNQPFAFEAQRPAIAARGLAEAENELAAFVRAGLRVVVAFPHRGEAARTERLLRKVEAGTLEGDLPAEAELLFAVSPARRGFVWRELGFVLLPDAPGLPPPRAPRRRAPRARAAVVRRPAHRRLRRPRGPRRSGSCSASRRRRSRASRATTSSSRSGARTGSTSRTSSSARSRATSAPTRRRPRSRSSAARPGRTCAAARASRCRSSPAS